MKFGENIKILIIQGRIQNFLGEGASQAEMTDV